MTEESIETKVALLTHRVTQLEADRKWLLSAAWGTIIYLGSQIVPLLPVLLKAAAK